MRRDARPSRQSPHSRTMASGPRNLFRPRRPSRLVLAVLLTATLVAAAFAGRFFSPNDPLQKSDVIVVLAGARLERWLEAVDLYKEGWAPRIVLSPGPLSELERKFRERGMRYPREGEAAAEAAISLGVPPSDVTVLPGAVDNTAAEAALFRRSTPDGSVRRVIVVTSPYHSRRARFAFRRELRNTGIEVLVRTSRYSGSRPSRWWAHRADIRFVMNEAPKLATYLLGLGE